MLFSRKKPVTVKLVGSTLVASFQNANPPLLWKFDLERNHSFTLALQGDEGDWEFGVTSPKGEFYSIAHFQAREDAEDAFEKTQKVLMSKKYSLAKTIGIFLAIALVLALAAVLTFSYFLRQMQNPSAITDIPFGELGGRGHQQPPQAGVPQAADDVLIPPY